MWDRAHIEICWCLPKNGCYLQSGLSTWGAMILPEILGGDVRSISQNPYPIKSALMISFLSFFWTQQVFPIYLAKFQSIMNFRSKVFWTFTCTSNSFPCFTSWLGIWEYDVIFLKISTHWNFNNNQSKTLHKYKSQSFCSSLCKLQCSSRVATVQKLDYDIWSWVFDWNDDENFW